MSVLHEYYEALLSHFGRQNWWPGDTTIEVVVGAVLTQNTNWQNVEKAIGNLKSAGVLDFQTLLHLPQPVLAEYIRPSGYYNLKAARLQNLLAFIDSCLEDGQELDCFFEGEAHVLREQLLSVKGVGPETADSILLYAGGKPFFVIDTYAYRLLSRHGFVADETSYAEMQEVMMSALPHEPPFFNEFHALIVALGKDFCKKKNPDCSRCPLGGFLYNSNFPVN